MVGRGASAVSKTRSGCRQCKVKRLKCDETTPACNNCVRRGWQCPGYQKHLRWSTKHERFHPPRSVPQSGETAASTAGKPLNNPAPDTEAQAQDTRPIQPIVTPLHATDAPLVSTNLGVAPSWFHPSVPYRDTARFSVANQSNSDSAIPDEDQAAHDQDQGYHLIEHQGNALARTHVDGSSGLDPLFVAQIDRRHSAEPTMFYTPLHLPTALVEYWFSDVCRMWSIFDSDANFNRQFASQAWSLSEPVSYAVQSMAAACLVETLPNIKPALASLTRKALMAIRERMASFQTTHAPLRFPTDLLFAITAMGTSLHWTYGYELGGVLVKDAQQLIRFYKGRLPSLTPVEREHLAYFHKALICWEALLCAADRDFVPDLFAARRHSYKEKPMASQDQFAPRQRMLGPPGLPLNEAEPHPWCGVSSDVLQLFGQVLTLCHAARRRQKTKSHDQGDSWFETSCDFGVACELASELAAMDFNPTSPQWDASQSLFVTEDNDTPLAHLVVVAEAYRKACYLQLCLTFEDLPIPKSPAEIHQGFVPAGGLTRLQEFVMLSLQLVEQLRSIPADSGSACMLPILYLCAATGLQIIPAPKSASQTSTSQELAAMDTFDSQQTGPGLDQNDQSLRGTQSQLSTHTMPRANDINSPSSTSMSEPSPDIELTVSALKVAQARAFVKRRLGVLQQMLPSKPTGMALKLTEAIWAEYDRTEGGRSPLYWFDVMVREHLQTFFG